MPTPKASRPTSGTAFSRSRCHASSRPKNRARRRSGSRVEESLKLLARSGFRENRWSVVGSRWSEKPGRLLRLLTSDYRLPTTDLQPPPGQHMSLHQLFAIRGDHFSRRFRHGRLELAGCTRVGGNRRHGNALAEGSIDLVAHPVVFLQREILVVDCLDLRALGVDQQVGQVAVGAHHVADSRLTAALVDFLLERLVLRLEFFQPAFEFGAHLALSGKEALEGGFTQLPVGRRRIAGSVLDGFIEFAVLLAEFGNATGKFHARLDDLEPGNAAAGDGEHDQHCKTPDRKFFHLVFSLSMNLTGWLGTFPSTVFARGTRHSLSRCGQRRTGCRIDPARLQGSTGVIGVAFEPRAGRSQSEAVAPAIHVEHAAPGAVAVDFPGQ